MKRRAGIRARRATPRRSARVRCPEYLAWVRTLPCCCPWFRSDDPGMSGCCGPVEAHHAGERGLGQKCSDTETIPLCTLSHRAWHDASGPFNGWARGAREVWRDARIAETQARARAEGVLPQEVEA